METSSRRIVETDITLTYAESERVAATRSMHELTYEVERRTQSVCKAVGGVCFLDSAVQMDSKTGAETVTFRCVSEEETGRICNMPNAPYLACDEASSELYKALAATPKK